MIDITTNYMGLQLKNPLVMGSSSMTGSVDEILMLEENGAAAVVLKSLYEEEILNEIGFKIKEQDHENPVYSQLSGTLQYIDSQGKRNKLSEYVKFIRNVKKHVDIPVIASINCISENEWIDYVPKIEQAGIDGIELNFFHNRSGFIGLDYEKTVQGIVKRVLKKVKVPVSVKIGNCFANQGKAISKLSKSGVAGLVLFSRFFYMDIDIYNLSTTSGKILSRSDEYYQSLRWIAMMSGKIDCTLVANTGIHHADTVIKHILAGADAVQIVSTLYLNGKHYIKQILSDLENWMDEKGFFSLKQVKGQSGYQKINDSVVYERRQCMQHFGRI